MLNASIAAAKAARARLVFPGNVDNDGPDAFPSLTEGSPQNPLTRKGAFGCKWNRRSRRLRRKRLKVLIVRGGDSTGPKQAGAWLGQVFLTPGKPVTRATYPRPLSVEHCRVFLPDPAEIMAHLAERNSLGDFEIFHMRGQTLSGEAMVAALARVVGRKLPVIQLPWFALQAISPFDETLRERLEMRDLWNTPVRLNNARLVARLGTEPLTPRAA